MLLPHYRFERQHFSELYGCKSATRKKANDQIIYCNNAEINRAKEAGTICKTQNSVPFFVLFPIPNVLPSLLSFKYQLNALTIFDTTVTLLRHVSA